MDKPEENENNISRSKRTRRKVVIVEENDENDSASEYCPSEDHESDASEYCSDHQLAVNENTKKINKKQGKAKVSRRKRRKITDDNDASELDCDEGSNSNKKKKKIKGLKKRKRKKTQSTNESEENICKETPRKEKVQRLGPYSVVGHWYIASGFVKDLTNLFKAFDQVDSSRFEAFAKCWVQCKFSLIYRGRYTFKEMLEFTEEVVYWTKHFLSRKYSMKWRIGAMYALYGIYYKHPFREHCILRMDLNEYENLVHLARSFQSSTDNPDPAYIFFKLTAEGAFYHTASSDEMGFSLYPSERQQEIMKFRMQSINDDHSADALYPEQDRAAQRQLLEEYERVKAETTKAGVVPEKGLSYVRSNILSEVEDILTRLNDGNTRPTPTAQTQYNSNDDDDDNDNTSKQAGFGEISDVGRRKLEVCKKAASTDNTQDYLQRKLLRSPQKRGKPADDGETRGCSPKESSVDPLFITESDTTKARKLEYIMRSMQVPQEDVEEASDDPLSFDDRFLGVNSDFDDSNLTNGLRDENTDVPNVETSPERKKPAQISKRKGSSYVKTKNKSQTKT